MALPAEDASAGTVRMSLILPKDTFLTGEPVTLSYVAPEAASRFARIIGEPAPGTDPADAEKASDFFAKHFPGGYYNLEGRPSGEIRFDAPYWPGNYVLRLMDGKNQELVSRSFRVIIPEGAGLSLERWRFRPAERIRVSYKTPDITGNPRIDLTPLHGKRNGSVSGMQVQDRPAGTVEMAAPLSYGHYTLHLYHSWGSWQWHRNGPDLATIHFEVIPEEKDERPQNTRIDYYEDIILDCDGDMTIHPEYLEVTDSLRVWLKDGENIEDRIHWEIPLPRILEGKRWPAGYLEILDARRDGRPGNWLTKRDGNLIRVVISKNPAGPGEHSYSLTYRIGRRVYRAAQQDWLQWNVTAGVTWFWRPGIVSTSARVAVPEETEILEASSDIAGDPEGVEITFVKNGALFRTTRPLRSREDLSLMISFPKGSFPVPSRMKEARTIWLYTIPEQVLLVVLVAMFLHFYRIWCRVGRDPEKRPIVIQYKAPAGLCPASVRFLRERQYDDVVFISALLSLAAKGHVTLAKEAGKSYHLKVRKDSHAKEASEAEQAVLAGFQSSATGEEVIRLGMDSGPQRIAEGKLREHFRHTAKRYFQPNLKYVKRGLIGSFLVALGCYLLFYLTKAEVILSLFLFPLPAVYFVITLLILKFAGKRFLPLRSILKSRKTFWFLVFGFLWFGFWFLASIAALVYLFRFMYDSQPDFTVLFYILALMNLVFSYLLGSVTPLGREMLDHIEGFRRFLKATEEQRLNFLHPPEKTPQTIQKYLPYAVALDCAHDWAGAFADAVTVTELKKRT